VAVSILHNFTAHGSFTIYLLSSMSGMPNEVIRSGVNIVCNFFITIYEKNVNSETSLVFVLYLSRLYRKIDFYNHAVTVKCNCICASFVS